MTKAWHKFPLYKPALETEHVGTDAARVLRDDGLISAFYHPRHGEEIDCLGVDLILFLNGPFCFTWQLKSMRHDLPTHFLNYPYISGKFLDKDRETKASVANEFLGVMHESAVKFFSKQSCVPSGVYTRNAVKKRTWQRQTPLRDALMKRSSLVAHYHDAMRHQEMQKLGFTGLVFLRNGFGLFLRRNYRDLRRAHAFALHLPKDQNPRKDADEIVRFIGENGKSLAL